MSEPLSAERFEQFIETYTENHAAIVGTLNDHTKRLDKIDERLQRIERHLWNEQRLVEHERRIRELAHTAGRPDLAIPFDRPIGS